MGRPTTTRRDRLYELLRDAGPAGVTLTELGEHGLRNPLAHVESLRFEGHSIVILEGADPDTGRLIRRVSLTRDAWAAGDIAA